MKNTITKDTWLNEIRALWVNGEQAEVLEYLTSLKTEGLLYVILQAIENSSRFSHNSGDLTDLKEILTFYTNHLRQTNEKNT